MDLKPIADDTGFGPTRKRSPNTRSITKKLRKCAFCGHLNAHHGTSSEPLRCDICQESLIQSNDVEVEIFEDEKLCDGCQSILPIDARECPECRIRYCRYCKVFLGKTDRFYCDQCSERATREHHVRKENEQIQRFKEIGFWITLIVVAFLAWKFLMV